MLFKLINHSCNNVQIFFSSKISVFPEQFMLCLLFPTILYQFMQVICSCNIGQIWIKALDAHPAISLIRKPRNASSLPCQKIHVIISILMCFSKQLFINEEFCIKYHMACTATSTISCNME